MTPTHEQLVFWMTPKRMRYLWDHIETVPRDLLGCWIWTGRDDKEGYAIYPTRIEGKRVNIPVHRLVMMLTYGGDWPEELEGSHTVCANRCCVNPTHVMADKHRPNLKNRKPWQRKARSAQGRIIHADVAVTAEGMPVGFVEVPPKQ